MIAKCPECSTPMKGLNCSCGYEKPGVIPLVRKTEHNSYRPYRAPIVRFAINTDLSRACSKLIWDRWDDKIDSFELGEAMYELAKKYPGIGLELEADKIISAYKERLENDNRAKDRDTGEVGQV